MKLLVTGGTGLIGRRLVADRLERGDHVIVVSRSAARGAKKLDAARDDRLEVVEGDPVSPGSWQDAVDGCDAVVHLAGAGILDRRWNAEYRRVLVQSRVKSAGRIAEAIEGATAPPKVLVSASAIGYYGDAGDVAVDEESPPAPDDFMADLTVQWERSASAAASDNTRVVTVRVGIVLDARGGALGGMLRPFRMFVGGPVRPGTQYLPWIHWRDLVGIVDLALVNPEARGPINGTGPNPVTMNEFCRTLGRVLRRPSWLPVPTFALRIVLGEVARHVAGGARVHPARALALGYEFDYPELRPALESLLAGSGGSPAR
ncbi:MAG: TIGR01777 family protein [Planctomycetes bacterium]|nr:TIGR01777 family protein [Planctomycetota bacterium]